MSELIFRLTQRKYFSLKHALRAIEYNPFLVWTKMNESKSKSVLSLGLIWWYGVCWYNNYSVWVFLVILNNNSSSKKVEITQNHTENTISNQRNLQHATKNGRKINDRSNVAVCNWVLWTRACYTVTLEIVMHWETLCWCFLLPLRLLLLSSSTYQIKLISMTRESERARILSTAQISKHTHTHTRSRNTKSWIESREEKKKSEYILECRTCACVVCWACG